jgi:type II secretory pathway component GspD/PulD (secretin)
MNPPLRNQYRSLFLILIFSLGCLPGLWVEVQALAEETGPGPSMVDIRDGRISVSAKDIPLRLLCKDIEDKSGIRFRIQDAHLGNRLSIELKDIPLLKGLKRLLAHMNTMFCFDNRNRLTEVLIAGRAEHYTPPVLRKPTPRGEQPRVRRSFSRPRP